MGATVYTDAQLRDKDYIIKYDNHLYIIGDHSDPANPLGIAQYFNSAMRSSGSRNYYKLVKVTIINEKMFVTKITVPAINVGQQLLTPYARLRYYI